MTRQQFWTLIAMILGSGIVFLDGTVVNIALPALSRDLGARFADLQWVVDGYLLSLSALILIAGSLGDILGRKRVYLVGLAGFGITSALCGIAWSIPVLVVMRILQGVSAALLVPGGLAIINTNFPSGIRSVAIGRWAAWSGVSTIIGPFVGGYLIDTFSWRWIFFINIPLVALCFALAYLYAHESRDDRPRTIDYAGAALAILFLAGITYGLIEGPAQSWAMVPLSALIAGIAFFVAFIIVEMRTHDPLVDLRLFAIRNFLGANLATFAMYGALSGFFFALVVYLQTIAGYSSTAAGLSLIPATLLLLAFSGRMGTYVERFGPRIFMTLGPILAGLGILMLIHLSPHLSYLTQVLPGVLLFGVGLTLTVTPLTVTVMNSVSQNDSGIASGINNALSRAAGLIVIAVLGILGASDVYPFAIALCGAMAILAGVMSWLVVRNKA
jgi:EmrB/QacA subfamily drug resistance transporter